MIKKTQEVDCLSTPLMVQGHETWQIVKQLIGIWMAKNWKL
jgi:hypothetical protein